MKAIDTFFTKTPFWAVYVISAISIIIMTFSMFYFFYEGKAPLNVNTKVSVALGLFLGFLPVIMVWASRESDKFWAEVEVVEKKIDDAKDRETLKSIWNNEMKELHRKASGGPHYGKLREMSAIMHTKLRYVEGLRLEDMKYIFKQGQNSVIGVNDNGHTIDKDKRLTFEEMVDIQSLNKK